MFWLANKHICFSKSQYDDDVFLAPNKANLSRDFTECFIILNIINFADMAKRERCSLIECEESFITMKFMWYSYQFLD